MKLNAERDVARVRKMEVLRDDLMVMLSNEDDPGMIGGIMQLQNTASRLEARYRARAILALEKAGRQYTAF